MSCEHDDHDDHDHCDDRDATTPEALVARAKELGATIDAEQASEVLAYLDAMLETNRFLNLTAVRDREPAIVLHALDSLAFARTGLQPHHVLDIGSGNGFPGVGVAALHPNATVTLLDKTGKKIRAITTCLITAGLDRVETIQMDAQQAPALRKDFRHGFDLVTARAVARPDVVARLAEPLTRPGGHLVLWLEPDADTPEKLGRFRLDEELAYELPAPAPCQRKLAIYDRR